MSESGTSGAGTSGRAPAGGVTAGSPDNTVDAAVRGVPQETLPGDPAALERLIGARRDRLAATVDELARRAHPRELARQGRQDAVSRFRSMAYTPAGRLRVERVGALVAAVAGVLALTVWKRRSHPGRARWRSRP
jgi:hypothetical protein